MINPFFFLPPLLCTWSWHMFLSLCGVDEIWMLSLTYENDSFFFGDTSSPPPPPPTLTWSELSFSLGLQLPLLHLASVSTSSTNRHHLPLRATTTAAASESGFPLCNTLFLFCSLYVSPPSISDHTLHLSLSFPLCVRLHTDGRARVCVCVYECARAYTHPCVLRENECDRVWKGTRVPRDISDPSSSLPILPPWLLLLLFLLLIIPPPSSRPAKCHKDAYQCPHTVARPCTSFGGLFTYSWTKSELPLSSPSSA